MFNWVENFWAQGICAVCSILVALFSGLAVFYFKAGSPFLTIFIIDVTLATLVFIGLGDW